MFKVGDVVFFLREGFGRVKSIFKDEDYPIEVTFFLEDDPTFEHQKVFTLDGKYVSDDKYRSLFTKDEALMLGFGPVPSWLQENVKDGEEI
jgi:hypothetical protein